MFGILGLISDYYSGLKRANHFRISRVVHGDYLYNLTVIACPYSDYISILG